MSARLVAALTLAALGCGPAVGSLVADRHYREAVCAAHDGRGEGIVERALEADANLLVHADVVEGDVVRAALARHEGAVPVTLFRVSAQSDVLPLDAVELSAAVGTIDGGAAALPARWDTLAWATGERLPPRRTAQTYLTGGNILRAGAAVATLGLSLLFTDFRPDTISVDARPEDYAREAPNATRLHALMERSGCRPHEPGGGAGVRCEWFFVYASSSQSPLAMALTARFVSNRLDPERHDRETCAITRRALVPLGRASTLSSELAARFAQGARPVREVEDYGVDAPISAWEQAAGILMPR
ncbi:MAG: hypothetical protein U0326_03265 [Polyangiales bacterium]